MTLYMVLVDPDVMFYMRTQKEQSAVAQAAYDSLDAGVQTFEWSGEYDSLDDAINIITQAAGAQHLDG